MSDIQYPEHERMAEFQKDSYAIGEFIERLPQYGLTLVDSEGDASVRLIPASRTLEQVLAQHFDIDLKKIEQEKQQMLEDIRQKQDDIPLDREPYDGIMWGDEK